MTTLCFRDAVFCSTLTELLGLESMLIHEDAISGECGQSLGLDK